MNAIVARLGYRHRPPPATATIILDARVQNPPQTFTDTSSVVWNISINSKVVQGGVEDGTTSQVTQMALVNGIVWQKNAPGNWFFKPSGGAGSWTAGSNPLPTGQAGRTQDFLRTIGYNMFAGEGGVDTGSILVSCFNYLNSTLARNQAFQGDSGLAFLAANVPGMRFCFLAMIAVSSDFDGSGTSSGAIAQTPWDVASTVANQLAQTGINSFFGVEGQNEANLFNSIGNASHPGAQSQWFAGNQGYAARVRANSALNSVPIINMTLGNPASNVAIYNAMGDVTTYFSPVNWGSYHAYPNDGTGGGDNFFSDSAGETPALAAVATTNPGRPWCLTETGYGIGGANGSHVTGLSGGKMMMNTACNCYLAGAAGVFFFELYNDTGEGLFLFDNLGNPNQMATVMHNFTTILKDTGGSALTFNPGAVSFTITGGVEGTDYFKLFFEKTTGEYELVLWNVRPVQTTGASPVDVTPASVDLTVHFLNPVSSTATFDATVGTTAVSTTGSTSSVLVSVVGYPKVLRFNP